jgi:hypothetical protein
VNTRSPSYFAAAVGSTSANGGAGDRVELDIFTRKKESSIQIVRNTARSG